GFWGCGASAARTSATPGTQLDRVNKVPLRWLSKTGGGLHHEPFLKGHRYLTRDFLEQPDPGLRQNSQEILGLKISISKRCGKKHVLLNAKSGLVCQPANFVRPQ